MGLQWGDEGKGRVVDWLAQEADMVVRVNGGANAGHTIPLEGGGSFAVHQLPSGVFTKALLAIGPGAVIDVEKLKKEIADAEALGVNVMERLFIDRAAHLILPRHKEEDAIAERARGEFAIGTTKTGNGPAYADKSRRVGVRFEGTEDGPLRARMVDVTFMALSKHEARFRILFEIAHGFELDIDHGAYPYVTSSSCGIGAVGTGGGFDPRKIRHVVGVMKPYSTRIGAGPFTQSFAPAVENYIREEGHEYGTTTGRPRRIGILDLRAIHRACWVNGVDSIAVTHMDIAEHLSSVPFVDCTGRTTSCHWSELAEKIHSWLGVPVRLISDGVQRGALRTLGGGDYYDYVWGLR